MNTKELKYGDKIASNIYFKRQLDYLGLKNKYVGYYLLVDIMQLMINEEIRVTSFSKQIYPVVAKKFNLTDCTIERNIRSLINKCWDTAIMVKLNIYMPNKPCCRDFIYLIKNFIVEQII